MILYICWYFWTVALSHLYNNSISAVLRSFWYARWFIDTNVGRYLKSLWRAIFDSVFFTIFASEIGLVFSTVGVLPSLLRGIIMNDRSASIFWCVENIVLNIFVMYFFSIGDPYCKYSLIMLSSPAALPIDSFSIAISVSSSVIGSCSSVGLWVLSKGAILWWSAWLKNDAWNSVSKGMTWCGLFERCPELSCIRNSLRSDFLNNRWASKARLFYPYLLLVC